MAQRSVLDIINIAKVSQYLAANDVANGELYGKRAVGNLPIILYVERKAVEWRYNKEGVTIAQSAISTITVDSLEGEGTGYLFEITDPQLGLITLGEYTEASGDTDTTILAASITAELNNNSYGYTFTSIGDEIFCTAPLRLGGAVNGISIVVTVLADDILINSTDILLINSTDKFLI